ncbi:hypothetical protein CEXT_575331 [Caerostris extrusa]|uniref:Uncharacterized protein n=1 Tax=Caerostris extrusa TaxID=172846 RepID=A0AAV4W672_CAEEX|nr:hypothetical protein CEXT_575331 [Caerostris extrusa]
MPPSPERKSTVFRDGAFGSNGLLIAEELELCLIPLTTVKLTATPACISREVFRDGAFGSHGLLIAEELELCLISLTTVKLSPCWVLRLGALTFISQIC